MPCCSTDKLRNLRHFVPARNKRRKHAYSRERGFLFSPTVVGKAGADYFRLYFPSLFFRRLPARHQLRRQGISSFLFIISSSSSLASFFASAAQIQRQVGSIEITLIVYSLWCSQVIFFHFMEEEEQDKGEKGLVDIERRSQPVDSLPTERGSSCSFE